MSEQVDPMFTTEELTLILQSVDKKIWAIDHVGRAPKARKQKFVDLRTKVNRLIKERFQ